MTPIGTTFAQVSVRIKRKKYGFRLKALQFFCSCYCSQSIFETWNRSWCPYQEIWWSLQVIFFQRIRFKSFLTTHMYLRRGARPEVHSDASGGLIRSILITLDDLKITEKTAKGGRQITRIGQQALDLVAGQVARGEV